jgi:hypothetical protein
MPKIAPGMAEFSGYVKEDLKRRFKAACSEAGRSMSEVLSELMEEWLSNKKALLSSKRSQVNKEVAYEPDENAVMIDPSRIGRVRDSANPPWKPVQDYPWVSGAHFPVDSPYSHPRVPDHLAEVRGLGVKDKLTLLYTVRDDGGKSLSRDELEELRKNISQGIEVEIVIVEDKKSL